MRNTIAAILSTKAEGLFGVAVKLSALPEGARHGDEADIVEAVAGVLEDIDRLLGSDFSPRFNEICDPGDCNRTWQGEDEAVQS